MTLADLRALCERATPGPWRVQYTGNYIGELHHRPNLRVIVDHREDFSRPGPDLDFIAAARTWLPALIEALAACDHLVCPTDHHTLGCLCSCAECDRRQAALARLDEAGKP